VGTEVRVEQVRVAVSFLPAVGFVSTASPRVSRSLTSPSLDGLRRRILVLLLARRGRRDRPIALHMDLDPAAQAEAERELGGWK
jgi:hypothetical protein